jgi:UDP-glucuronate decarboxylase
VRIFNTYGPRMHPDDGRVVSNFIVQALRGEDITIYGDGEQTRSFCYVDDLIEGAAAHDGHRRDGFTGPVNLGNPGEYSMLELAETILRMTPSDDPKQRCPDIAIAKDRLGWEPKVTLTDGLEPTITYFRQLICA